MGQHSSPAYEEFRQGDIRGGLWHTGLAVVSAFGIRAGLKGSALGKVGSTVDESSALAKVADEAPISGLGSLSRAGQYGIQPYNSLTKLLKGSGLQAHHLLEQRFAGVLGVSPRSMSSIALTPAEHQIFTNAWRQLIPYGSGTANATREQIMNAARIIYKDYPDILKALGL